LIRIGFIVWHASCNHPAQVACKAISEARYMTNIAQESVMSVSSRLITLLAAAVITAVSFAGPAFASPNSAAFQVVPPVVLR
jgi:hypothetical protein